MENANVYLAFMVLDASLKFNVLWIVIIEVNAFLENVHAILDGREFHVKFWFNALNNVLVMEYALMEYAHAQEDLKVMTVRWL